MNQAHLPPDDPRLTAYALGELPDNERIAIEAAVQADPALQAAVAEIRALAGDLSDALASEPVAAPLSEGSVAPAPRPESENPKPGRVARFPYFLVSGLAAAGFAVMVAVHETRSPVASRVEEVATPERQVFELMLPSVVMDVENPAAAGVAVDAVAAPVPDLPTVAQPLLDQIRAERLAKPQDPGVVFLAPASVSPMPASVRLAEAVAAGPGDHGIVPARSSGPTSGGAMMTRMSSTGRDVVEMAPMMVEESSSVTYAGTSSLAGSRGFSTGFAPGAIPRSPAPPPPLQTEAYAYTPESRFVRVVDQPLSTFAVDVDTASYANVRRFLQNGQRPPVDAVRIEELVNYFPYRYPPPATDTTVPFAAGIEAATAPWNPAHRLVRIGLKGREMTAASRPAANLVFLLDVSGSMDAPNRLPLVIESMRLLVDRLRPEDRVAIVTYAGNSGLALPSTPVSSKREIHAALEALRPGGSTHGSMGIHLAYDIARANFLPEGLNRVILCTDGDFNVGVTSQGELVRLVEEKARSGVFLTVFGFGMGNYKDSTLESLANRGNGVYGYIDSAREARKLLVEQVEGTLATIAKDVKIQVEFNPAQVSSYRLIGYENRTLNRQDFVDDSVDAGEIGAGHTVTALYEVIPIPAASGPAQPIDPLRYQPSLASLPRPDPALLRELLTVKVRYKTPQGTTSEQVDFPFTDRGSTFADATGDFKFAASVAGFGMILRNSPHKGQTTFDQVLTWAQPGLADDKEGHRVEFVELVKQARALTGG